MASTNWWIMHFCTTFLIWVSNEKGSILHENESKDKKQESIPNFYVWMNGTATDSE